MRQTYLHMETELEGGFCQSQAVVWSTIYRLNGLDLATQVGLKMAICHLDILLSHLGEITGKIVWKDVLSISKLQRTFFLTRNHSLASSVLFVKISR